MSSSQNILQFLYSEFDWVIRENDTKLLQLANEFTALSKDAQETFFAKFTKQANSARYTFEDIAKLCQYFAVRQILSNIADDVSTSLKLGRKDALRKKIQKLKGFATDSIELIKLLKEKFYSRVVLTGHPTEFASDSTIELVHGITDLLLDEENFENASKRSLHTKMAKLFEHKLTPKHKLSVEEEISRNLKHLHRIYKFIGKLRAEFISIFSELWKDFGSEGEAALDDFLANSIEFRSWTGGDADGNFRVVADKMAKAVNLHKHAAAKFHLEYFKAIDCSDLDTKRQLKDIESLIKDLALEKAIIALQDIKTLDLEAQSKIKTLILLMRIFGKNTAAIDVRQNMFVLSNVVAEILSGMRSYIEEKSTLSEDEAKILKILTKNEYHKYVPKPTDSDEKDKNFEQKRLEILNAILDNPTVLEYATYLQSHGWYKDRYAIVTEEIARMQMVTIFPNIFKNYIISNSEGASSVLQMLILSKICGAKPHFVPLFETKEGLANAHSILETLLANKHYRKYLTGKSQKVMVGYSDSQKDNGICVLPLIDQAIRSWGDLSKKSDVAIEVFHGNGLDLARGGPRIIESEQTFQGNNIRYTFLNYSDLIHYYSNLLDKVFSAPIAESYSLGSFVEAGCEAFSELKNAKGYHAHLEKFFEKASPFELFVKPNNFSSRPSKRNANDAIVNPYEIWFQDLVLDSEDIINGIRAIPWVIAIEGTFTYFNLWYGFRNGFAALNGIQDANEQLKGSRIFQEIMMKILIAIECADFELAWRYLPEKDRAKSKGAIERLASKSHNHSEKIEHQNYFLGMLHKEFEDTKELVAKLGIKLPADVLEEIQLQVQESIFLRSFMAWLNLKLVGEQISIKELFLNPDVQVFEKMCGSLYLGFNEFRMPPKAYLNR